MLRRFKREHIKREESNEHKTWVSPEPKKNERGRLAVYFMSNKGNKGFFIPGGKARMRE